MNDLERTLYTKGLETIYGSVLLGDDRALNQIEEMVYLTREFVSAAGSRQPLKNEVLFIENFCSVCWPDAKLAIILEGRISDRQVLHKSLSGTVCRALVDFETHGQIPEMLTVWEKNGRMEFRLEQDGKILMQGVASDG